MSNNEGNATMPAFLHKAGYDAEEEYFYRYNKELIEKNRKELDAQRAETEARERQCSHWMKCPKCGCDLVEREMMGLKADVCTSCQGVFFDHGELDMLLKSAGPKSFFDTIKGLMSGAFKPGPTGIHHFPV